MIRQICRGNFIMEIWSAQTALLAGTVIACKVLMDRQALLSRSIALFIAFAYVAFAFYTMERQDAFVGLIAVSCMIVGGILDSKTTD